MNTYLGVSSLLSADDLDEEAIAAGAVLYMEGYLFDRDDAKEAFRRAAGVAHANGRKVSLTLSDSFCVDRHRDDFRRPRARRGRHPVRQRGRAVLAVRDRRRSTTAIAAVRARLRAGGDHRSAPTARSSSPPTTSSHVPAEPVDRVLDTTGAGDLYAAGFLYGSRSGVPLDECGRLGSIAAAEVISHVGPRPLVELRTLVCRDGLTDAALGDGRRAGSPPSPIDDIRAELQALLDGDADDALAERFAGRLQFGTAGLRAAVGAGPLRMNRLVVRQAAAGLAEYLLDARPARRRARRRHRLRRPPQERRVRPRHGPGAGRRRASGAMLLPGPLPDAGAGVVDHRARRRRRRDGHGVAQPAGRQRLQGVPRRRRPDRAARTTSAIAAAHRRASTRPTVAARRRRTIR